LLTGAATRVLYEEWSAAREALVVRVLAYVLMPDHFHLLLWAEQGARVRKFLQRTLAVTSKKLEPGRRFWKERPRVLPVYSREVLQTKVDYLHGNPVRRGAVASPAEWRDSSYRQVVMGCDDAPFVCDSWDGISG